MMAYLRSRRVCWRVDAVVPVQRNGCLLEEAAMKEVVIYDGCERNGRMGQDQKMEN